MRHSRHVVPAAVLLAMAGFATWNVVNNADWPQLVLPFGPAFRTDVSIAAGLAVTWWAGGLGILTRTSVGVWLGRLGASVLVALGTWLLWDTVAHPSGSTLFGDPLLIVVPMTAVAVGAGIGILVALRHGTDARSTADRPGGPED